MISVWGRSYCYRKRLFIALFYSCPLFELGNKLFNQPAGPPGTNLFITIVFATTSPVSKYIKEDLQQILKTILKAETPTIFEKLWDKSLKARFLDMYYGKSYMEC